MTFPDFWCGVCARFDEDVLDEAQAARGALSWEQIEQRAAREALTPLLYSLWRKQTWVPQSVLERWHRIYLHTAMRNTLRLAELTRVLGGFGDIKIPVILLKGAALLKLLYGNVALRPMADLDLLVHLNDAPFALQLLESLGYVLRHPEERLCYPYRWWLGFHSLFKKADPIHAVGGNCFVNSRFACFVNNPLIGRTTDRRHK